MSVVLGPTPSSLDSSSRAVRDALLDGFFALAFGLDIDMPAGQTRRQAGILPGFADRQRKHII